MQVVVDRACAKWFDQNSDRIGLTPHCNSVTDPGLHETLLRPEPFSSRVSLDDAKPQPARPGLSCPPFEFCEYQLSVASSMAFSRQQEQAYVPNAFSKKIGDHIGEGDKILTTVDIADTPLAGIWPAFRRSFSQLLLRRRTRCRLPANGLKIQRIAIEEMLQLWRPCDVEFPRQEFGNCGTWECARFRHKRLDVDVSQAAEPHPRYRRSRCAR